MATDEQYRHATYASEPYYEEALRRDAGDVRANTAMGILYLKRGMYREAEERLVVIIREETQLQTQEEEEEDHLTKQEVVVVEMEEAE